MRDDGSTVEGLNVCGNDQGGFCGTGYPWHYGGINIGRAITFRRLAAMDVAAR